MDGWRPQLKERIKGAALAGALQAALGYALLTQFNVPVLIADSEAIKVFEVVPPAPVKPERQAQKPKEARSKPREAAAPPNLKSDPVKIVAPPPVVPIPPPPPVVAAPVAGTGVSPSAGAADTPGPGTGAGGEGAGRGGGGDGGFTAPRWLRGELKDSDFPRDIGDAGLGELMTIRFTVATNGRAINCAIDRSSGNPRLDGATCRGIEKRYRFRPALDENGEPVPVTMVEDHRWHKHEDD